MDALYTVRAVTGVARTLTCYHQLWQVSWLSGMGICCGSQGPPWAMSWTLLFLGRGRRWLILPWLMHGGRGCGENPPSAWGPPFPSKGRVDNKQAKLSFWIFSQSLTIFSPNFHRYLSIFVFSNPQWISSPCLFSPLNPLNLLSCSPRKLLVCSRSWAHTEASHGVRLSQGSL